MMNSGTSTSSKRKGLVTTGTKPGARGAAGTNPRGSNPKGGGPAGKTAAAPVAVAENDAGLQPIHMLILATMATATVAALAARGTRPANIIFLVLAVVAAGVAAAAIYRTLWPLASEFGSAQPEMLGGRTRAALEREKTIILRAIKELEFDRAMGKVSEADCEEMIGRLRGRAVRLIRQLDAGSAGYRELIERELNARLGARGRSPQAGRPGGAMGRTTADADVVSSACAVCGVSNEADAKFCKACGAKLGEEGLGLKT